MNKLQTLIATVATFAIIGESDTLPLATLILVKAIAFVALIIIATINGAFEDPLNFEK